MKTKSQGKLIDSFKYAIEGIKYLFSHERNFRIHCFFSIVIPIMGIFFKISLIEMMIVIIHITLVLSLEAINSLVEYILDIKYPYYDERVKIIKDVSAGIVLIAALSSLTVGCIIFIPKIIDFLQ